MSLTQESKVYNYQHIEGDIPKNIPSETFISLNRKPPLKIYNLGFQPAKSIPEIPRWFLQKYANSSKFTILEPFAGSGTTLLEAIQHNSSIYWLDYHPLSRLICQVKTHKFSLTKIEQEATKVIEKSHSQKQIPETINFANKDFWFQKPVQEALEILRAQILKTHEEIQPILWLAFATTVRKTSNMNDGMILAAKRSHIEAIPNYSRTDVFDYFKSYVKKAITALIEWHPILNNHLNFIQELSSKDARKLPGTWQVDAIITSPPYINAIDYVWASKFELHWLGLVKNNRERLELYSQEIGTERISRADCQVLGQTGHSYLDQLIEGIYRGDKYQASRGQNQLRARVVYQYFMDMIAHFSQSLSHLKSQGYYCFSIGQSSRICGVDIPVASILTDLACQLGFIYQEGFHILLKNRRLNIPRNVDWATTIKHDTVVVLQKK